MATALCRPLPSNATTTGGLIAAGAPQNALRFPCPKELVIMLS
ncbi:hypothetical protein [Edwardsiella ictaluri]|uniref:Uncharacterized protein n=1 Tax=Edwardsiella ictaluri (strain 93-146) TaxID=634503 RepID=C5BGI3_EDWI9|nr:hypothetical protein NT01EI_3248 [Edwardsiella ictaluri 93-146]